MEVYLSQVFLQAKDMDAWHHPLSNSSAAALPPPIHTFCHVVVLTFFRTLSPGSFHPQIAMRESAVTEKFSHFFRFPPGFLDLVSASVESHLESSYAILFPR